MRLAYFTNTYPRATDTFIRIEVSGLRKRGFEVFTYSVRKAGSEHDVDKEVIHEKRNTKYLLPFNFFSLLGLNVKLLFSLPGRYLKTLILAMKTSRPGVKGHLLQIIYFFEAILLSKRLVDDEIAHLHNHLGDNSGTVTLLAAKLADIPFSISIHGPHIFFDGLHWALDKKTEYAKFISCIGYYCRSQMMLYSDKQYWSKFQIIRCGIDLNKFFYREPNGVARKMVYVGRISSEKGLPILFESLLKLKELKYDFELTLLGDGEDKVFLENTAKETGLDKYVNFLGFVDQDKIAETLKTSDIFILPSYAEGIPVALMEAMAIGIPVIATYVGGVAELVIDQKNGQVIYPSDSDGLARAIMSYIDNPDFCKEVSKNARATVESKFDIEDQVDKLAALFKTDNVHSA